MEISKLRYLQVVSIPVGEQESYHAYPTDLQVDYELLSTVHV